MKLSEAIRAGAKLRPQSFGAAYKPLSPGSEDFGSCALGAAYEATFGLPQTPKWQFSDYLHGAYPVLYKPAKLPLMAQLALGAEAAEFIPLAQAINYLNDTLRYSREQIADFVASYEAMLDEDCSGRTEEE